MPRRPETVEKVTYHFFEKGRMTEGTRFLAKKSPLPS